MSEKQVRDILNEMCDLKILDHDPLEDTYVITELYSKKLYKAVKYIENHPPPFVSDYNSTLAGVVLIAYLETVQVSSEDKMKLHVSIIKSMFDTQKDKRLAEFGARLRLLERVKKH